MQLQYELFVRAVLSVVRLTGCTCNSGLPYESMSVSGVTSLAHALALLVLKPQAHNPILRRLGHSQGHYVAVPPLMPASIVANVSPHGPPPLGGPS
jgi:hypothetical protein